MNKIYDYVIVGTGPTGLALAWYLSQENKTVLLVDRENSIGGCHRVQRVLGLLTEHGPRVYSNVYLHLIHLLKEMNLDFNELFTPYTFDLSNIGDESKKKFKFHEMLSFVWAFCNLFFYPIYGQDISMKVFMEKNSFTPESTDYIERLCRLTDGAQTDRYTLFQFLQLINNQSLYLLYQPVKPNDDGLFKLIKTKLEETKLVDFSLDHDVISLNNNNSEIKSINVIDKSNLSQYDIYGKKFILAIPPEPLYKLVTNSNTAKYAFGSIDSLKNWSDNNSYFEYIPITLHWKIKQNLPKIWGFPASDWGLAFIVLSNYMKFDRLIEIENSQTVISTAITFTDKKSKHTNKTADESTMNEIHEEVMRQLRLSYPDLPNPDYMLTSPQVYREDNKWVNSDTAFVSTPNKNQYLPFKSQIFNNLYNCGAHNGKSNYHFTSMETSIANALYLFNKLETSDKKRNIKEYKQLTNYIRHAVLIILFVIGYYFLSKHILYAKYK